MEAALQRLNLKYNPFEAAASGAPLTRTLWVPERWKQSLEQFLDRAQGMRGPKAFAVLGEYGSGKTYLLRWLEREALIERRIRPFLFDNPGVQFYDLANALLKKIGREEFSKSLWELVHANIELSVPVTLFAKNPFLSWLESVKAHRLQEKAARALAITIRQRGITENEEISYKLGQLVVQTVDKPYFEYKDFVAGRSSSLVAEREEAPYFAAIVRILKEALHANAVAFLIDEFEEISLQRRLTTRQSYDYLATLKRLINVTESENLWIVLAMTPQAAEISAKLDSALWERFISQGRNKLEIPPLNDAEAQQLIEHRLEEARTSEKVRNLFPFPDNLLSLLREDVKSSPRRLIKVASYAISEFLALPHDVELPFSAEYLSKVQENLYPQASTSAKENA